jgi:DNA phosphorothioation system restriction enzyme
VIGMGFKELDISYQYRSDNETGNLINDFYIPVLSETKIYSRAVGYFSSHSLVLAAKGLSELISRGGRMRLIASPQLSGEDIDAINKGYQLREGVIESSLLREIKDPKTTIEIERLNYLAWLIENNQLDIKIAVTKNHIHKGIYHEKLGLLEDWNGNKIAFTGSSNETEGGLIGNFETIDVFCSWLPAEELRVNTKEINFDKLWENNTENLQIMDFPEAVKERILSFKQYSYKRIDPESELDSNNELLINENEGPTISYPRIPSVYEIRDYQKEAVEKWFMNNGRGLLEMATGTGKTITALTAASMLYKIKKVKKLAIVIVCPYKHLVDQWEKEAKTFNMKPLIAYHSRSIWEERLNQLVTAFNTDIIEHFSLITTVSTFTSKHMQALIDSLHGEVMIIADEAHHLGAKNVKRSLPMHYPYRLALSATPNRWYDEEGTDHLLSYFGNKVVFQYGLDKAIENNFLTEYFYYPHIVYLDDDESELYFELTKKIARMYPSDGDFKNASDSLQALLIERARVMSRARGKLDLLRTLMQEKQNDSYNIVYCGDSQVDGEKQIDAVIRLLGKELNMKVHSFTSREDQQERQRLLNRFEKGDLQTLVAIKCLDEGVDVPATQTAYIMASSTNPREFIQRRGRVLRKHPKKNYSYIHDFLVLPRNLKEVSLLDAPTFNIERNMVKRELNRFSEFSNLALNGPKASETINEVKKIYNLLDQ